MLELRLARPRSRDHIPRLRTSAVGAIVVVLIAVVYATGAVAEPRDDSPCEVPPPAGPPSESTVHGKTPDGRGNERTDFFEGDRYRVTRCNPDGSLIISQVVGRIRVPEDKTALVPLSTTRPGPNGGFESFIATYGPPEVPLIAELWRRYGDETRARVLPPTTEATR